MNPRALKEKIASCPSLFPCKPSSRARFAGQSWEIYGDWTDDVSKLETTVVYLLNRGDSGETPA